MSVPSIEALLLFTLLARSLSQAFLQASHRLQAFLCTFQLARNASPRCAPQRVPDVKYSLKQKTTRIITKKHAGCQGVPGRYNANWPTVSRLCRSTGARPRRPHGVRLIICSTLMIPFPANRSLYGLPLSR